MRVKPQNMYMCEATSFGQRWTCATTDPLIAALTDEYFLPMRSQLYAGDEIRVCEVTSMDRHTARVLRWVDLLVVEAAMDRVETMPIGDVRDVPEAAPQATAASEPDERYITGDGEVRWNLGKKVHEVVLAGEVIASSPDKDEACRIARGELPLPQAA